MKLVTNLVFVMVLPFSAIAQTGNGFDLSHNVIASGGGASSGSQSGQNYSVEGTIGQGIAGTQSSGIDGVTVFRVRGGFWAFQAAAPTAAAVSVSGRIFTADGNPLFRAHISLIDMSGAIRTAISNQFGYYRFDDIEAGQTYLFEVNNKRFMFVPQVVFVNDELANMDFTALP